MPDSRLVPEVCHVSDDVVIRRGVVLAVVAVLLFAWVFLYRFNTLGGALGGFDNDHFLYMTIAKQVRERGGDLRLGGLNDDLRQLFELTKLDTLFSIAHTRQEALASF